ncbi:hypothetical protein BZB76_3823 [Actinomadura pelletieri DSM 43383]|uniref:Uncharacterized protein n=1 Tax=Actinomadura pelletieri DSM 43383 TaxID=1120940 RepID=A0A495QKR3_9ACTN|nr:hypothetical protein BZB76_3823 [Actinomadura pelletieri DSM 43383]
MKPVLFTLVAVLSAGLVVGLAWWAVRRGGTQVHRINQP